VEIPWGESVESVKSMTSPWACERFTTDVLCRFFARSGSWRLDIGCGGFLCSYGDTKWPIGVLLMPSKSLSERNDWEERRGAEAEAETEVEVRGTWDTDTLACGEPWLDFFFSYRVVMSVSVVPMFSVTSIRTPLSSSISSPSCTSSGDRQWWSPIKFPWSS
jgi:hypothetical protein